MSRLLLVGCGMPALIAAPRHHGPGLRAAHLAVALARAGHAVTLVVFGDGIDGARDVAVTVEGSTIEIVFAEEAALVSGGLARLAERSGARAVVGVSVYAASFAARAGLGLPLWADMFGDLMAEAQAKAVAEDDDFPLAHFWTLMLPALERADRFSAVSRAQADALVGQLGLAGRLSRATAGQELVAVMPCAAAVPAVCAVPEPAAVASDAAVARRLAALPADAFVALWSGGFNTWCDVPTLTAALDVALQQCRSLHVVVVGGAIPRHHEKAWADFVVWHAGCPHRERVHLCGWVDSGELPALYARADVGLLVERPSYERRLGAENRVAEWVAHGVVPVTSACSEAGRALCEAGAAFAFAPGEPADLARVLVGLAADRVRVGAAAAAAVRYAAEHLQPDLVAAPLLRWCAAPEPAGDHAEVRVVSVGLVSRPETMTALLESYVAALGNRELARRGLRWVLRRILGRH